MKKQKIKLFKKFLKSPKKLIIFFIFLKIFFFSCSKKKETSSEDLPLGVSELTQVVGEDGYSVGSFIIPPDGISFLLSIFKNNNSSIAFYSLTDPDGSDILNNSSTPNLYGAASGSIGGTGYANILVPQTPDFVAKPGTWTFKAYRNDRVNINLRYGSVTSNPKIFVQPFITGTTWQASDLSEALSITSSIYSKNGITLSINDTIIISDSQYSAVSGSFTDSTTSALVSNGLTECINLFFIEDYSGSWSGILGNAAGMPGSMGMVNSWNGVLISLTAHASGTSLDSLLLGETAAHEMGHQLGLFHTSESGGTIFDILNDTEECPITKDNDSNSKISAEECEGYGSDNVMFWTSWSSSSRSAGKRQNIFSNNQNYILKYSPITR